MKHPLAELVCFGLLALSGCSTANTNGPMNTNSGTTISNAAYKSKQAITYGDVVVDGVGRVSNMPVFTRFYNDVQSDWSDKIRITSYTDEGYPIFIDFNFDGKIIQYTFDNSHDKFGGSNSGRKSTTCTGISSQQVSNDTVYVVTGCHDTNMPSQILWISSSQR